MGKKDNSLIKVDTVAGSRTYNRLEMQLSQTLHMAIELYEDLNYLLVVDHYDDITIFDLDAEPLVVSYYQMKTSDNSITIDSAIKEEWFAKLYAQFNRPEEWIVGELGLITNTPLEISYCINNEDGSSSTRKEKLFSDRTTISELPSEIQQRIKADIASKFEISSEQVDLSKFAHLRTTLTIDRHKDLAQKEVEDFLYKKYPRITVDTVRGIYSSLIEILTRKQEFERLPSDAPLADVQKNKGISRDDISQVIDKGIMLSIPTFEDVIKYARAGTELLQRISLPYVQILADSNKKDDESFPMLFNEVLKAISNNEFDGTKTPWEYGLHIGTLVHEKEPVLCVPYSCDYIAVLTVCLLINKFRRKS